MKRIIALDPGGTTGWALWEQHLAIHGTAKDVWNVGQMGPEDHHSDLYAHLERCHTHEFTVVCESFEFRQNRQRDNINLMSREYIGVTKLFGQERSTPVVFQTAARAKGFVTDQKLKAMGLWWPGNKHAMDAMRHLITYMVQKERRYDLIESWKNL